jgi:hypothetical protein
MTLNYNSPKHSRQQTLEHWNALTLSARTLGSTQTRHDKSQTNAQSNLPRHATAKLSNMTDQSADHYMKDGDCCDMSNMNMKYICLDVVVHSQLVSLLQ